MRDVADKLHVDDLNLVVLRGQLAQRPDVIQMAAGSEYIRYLVTVRTRAPKRRVDVIPVIYWNPGHGEMLREAPRGSGIYVVAQAQRRFYVGLGGRKSKVEIIATSVVIEEKEEADANSSDV